jgi:ribonuclease J
MGAAAVTFLGGVREIGGNKILIEDGPDRILFDFGPSFSPQMEEYYVDYLQPRSTSPVKDLLEFDLLPRVPGLYSKEALGDADLRYESPQIHAIFVSHAHADHAAYLHLLDPQIPVYVGEGTRRLMEAIEATYSGRLYSDHDWRVFEDRKPIKLGKLEVVPYPVDHSIPWAYGFLIRTSDGTLVYTGDFRRHGPRGADTDRFLAAAAKENPVGLIIEGTRAGPDPRKNFSEQGVREGVDSVLGTTQSLSLVCTYPRDLDRLSTLYQAARAVDRELVVSFKTAALLDAVAASLPSAALPSPLADQGIRIYGRRKGRYYNWEKPYLEASLSAADVKANGRKYLLALDLLHFAELIDLRPEPGSPFIHSMSEPFSEDDINDKVFHNWLDHFQLPCHQMHASGHCSGPELTEIVRGVKARTVYPVHTEHPEFFEQPGIAVRSPVKGERYRLG